MFFRAFLTSPTPTQPVEIVDLVPGELSSMTVVGVIVALVTCIAVIAASCFVAYKWRGNAGGAMMAFVMGVVGAIIAPSLANILFQLLQGVRLTNSTKAPLVFVGFALFALFTAAVDLGVRYYVLYYMDKTGLGLHKGLSIACGYSLGSVVRYLTNLFYTTLYVFAIKKGTFVTEEMKIDPESYNQRANFQNAAMLTPTGTYFAYSLQFIAVALLFATLTIYMIRTWLEEKKAKGALVAGGAMFAFELVRGMSAAAFSAKMVSESGQYWILTVLYVLVIAGCIYALTKILNNYPKGREKFMKSMRQRAEEAEQKQRRSAWSQINEYNSKSDQETESSAENFEAETGYVAAEESAVEQSYEATEESGAEPEDELQEMMDIDSALEDDEEL